MTEFQKMLLWKLELRPNESESITVMAHILKSNRLAVYSSCKALERQGLVQVWRHGDDQWAALYVASKRAKTQ